MPLDEIARRTAEAQAMGATEICAQAGLPPMMDPFLYEKIARTIHAASATPVHLHAFSPEEVLYAAKLSRRSVVDTLRALQDAGNMFVNIIVD